MNDVFGMAIAHSWENLLHVIGSHFLREKSFFFDSVEKLAARAEICDQVEVVLVLEKIVNRDDVRMDQVFQDVDFCEELLIIYSQDRAFLYRFHCPDYSGPFVHNFSHVSKLANSDRFQCNIILMNLSIRGSKENLFWALKIAVK